MEKPRTKSLLPSFILFAMAVAVCLPTSRLIAAAEIIVVDPMDAVYPDIRPTALPANAPLAAPQGGTMLVQVVLRGEPGQLLVKQLDLVENGEVSGAQWYAMDSVPVEQNTGVDYGTEALDGRKNHYVIRRAPFEIADALVPVGEGWDSEAWKSRRAGFDQRGSAAFAVRWSIPRDVQPGLRHFTVTAELADGKKVSSRFSVQVYPFAVPSPEQGTFNLVQSSAPEPIAYAHKVPLWSEEFWALYAEYARVLAEGRQSTGFINLDNMNDDCPTGPEPQFGERVSRAIKIFKAAGMRDFLGAGLFKPIPSADGKRRWGMTGVEPALGTPEGDAKARALFSQVRKAIEENGVTGKFKMQIFDEVPESDNSLYIKAAKILHEEMPGVKIYEVISSPNLGIADVVDEWCPMSTVYAPRQDFFAKQKAAGKQVSIYTCMGPGGPWVNRLLDQERTRVAHIPWFVYGYDLDGYLHWGANAWGSDPFKKSVIPTTGAPNLFLPAGDTHILYPGDRGPWISLRYEAQRLGAEDYEALYMIGKQSADGARELVFKHFPAMNTGPRDGASYWQARHDLLAAASGLPASALLKTEPKSGSFLQSLGAQK